MEGLLDGARLASVALSGSVLVYGLHRHQASAGLGLAVGLGRGDPPWR